MYRHRLLLATLFAAALTFSIFRGVHADATHQVAPGETLSQIAVQYGVSVEQITAFNGIVNPDRIFAGQLLTIPGADGGDANVPVPAASLPGTHSVLRGETLSGIALRYGITTASLAAANNIANPNMLYAGQRLVIPGEGTVSAPAPGWVAAPKSKSIIVDISDQRTYVYQDGVLLYNFISSTGQPGSDTWTGTWSIRSKIPNAYAQLWGLQMPYWLGFYHTGYLENGFHALPILPDGSILWAGYLGTPVSYGCVILSYPDAATLYNWADIGTEVIVRN